MRMSLESCDNEQDEKLNEYVAAVVCLVEQFKNSEEVASFAVIHDHKKNASHILNWLNDDVSRTGVSDLPNDAREAIGIILQYSVNGRNERLVCRVDFHDRILETSDDVMVYIRPEESIRGALVYTRSPGAMAHIRNVKSWIHWLHDNPHTTKFQSPGYLKLKDVAMAIKMLLEENTNLEHSDVVVEYNASVNGMVVKLIEKEQ